MLDDPKRLRERAIECRAIARGVNWADASILEEIADEFQQSAAWLERARLSLRGVPLRGGHDPKARI